MKLTTICNLGNKQPTGLTLQISQDAFDDESESNCDTIFERLFVSYVITGEFLLTNIKKDFDDLNRKDLIKNCGKNVCVFAMKA